MTSYPTVQLAFRERRDVQGLHTNLRDVMEASQHTEADYIRAVNDSLQNLHFAQSNVQSAERNLAVIMHNGTEDAISEAIDILEEARDRLISAAQHYEHCRQTKLSFTLMMQGVEELDDLVLQTLRLPQDKPGRHSTRLSLSTDLYQWLNEQHPAWRLSERLSS